MRSRVAASLRSRWIRLPVVSLLLPGLTQFSMPVLANPAGGIVVHGDVRIGAGHGGNLQIQQNSRNAIIDWQSFSIAAGELTQFRQPGANAAVLNRVTGGDPTAIHGALRANGNVFVINPNGILVGPSGAIDVHGLVLSTLDLSNGEFLAGGDLTFAGAGQGVTNLGRINAIGGDVFLIGRTVNNRGSIHAPNGTVGLAAGEEVLLTADKGIGHERIFVRAKGSGVSGTGIFNDGTIEGAAVELKAHGNIYALAINNKGSIRATGASTEGGRVFLRGAGGTVSNSGSIRASSSGVGNAGRILIEAAYAKVDGILAAQGGDVRVSAAETAEVGGRMEVSDAVGRGGNVTVEAREIVMNETASIDASGGSGGGRIRIGGGLQGRDDSVRNAENLVVSQGASLRANANTSGIGGSVILWSDGDTLFRGEILAKGPERGGFAEVSGRRTLTIDDSRFDLGEGGQLLLDPADFTVTDMVRNAILPTLNGGTDVVIYTNGADAGVGTGSIIMSSNFSGTSAITGNGSLSLMAWGDVFIRRDLLSNGSGNINVVAGWDGSTPGSFGAPGGDTNTTGTPLILMDSQIFADTSTYGNRGGSVYVGLETDKVTPVNQSTTTMGSRAGQTNVAGFNLVMVGDNTAAATSGDDRSAQIGYRASDIDVTLGRAAATGRIRVEMLNDITMSAGLKTAATGNHSATPGQYNYVQIGHGGRDATSNGYNLSGDIILRAGLGSDAGITGNITATGGNNLGGFVRVGHGGHNGATASGSFSGDITVEASGAVTFTGGAGRRAFAQIGHGGHDVDAGTTLGGAGYHSGDIAVRAGGSVSFTGGIGYTGGTTGDLFVTDGRSFAMIGHGGYASEARGLQGHQGDIVVDAGGSLLMKAGDIDDNFSQIGHGGGASQVVDAAADGHSGNIAVTAATGITLLAGTGQTFRTTQDGQMFSHIGHGGYNSGSGNNLAPVVGSLSGHSGDISVTTATGDILIYGGNTANGSAGNGLGRLHFAQIGHGGHGSPGAHHGDIVVESTAGAIDARGGATTDDATDGTRNFALIGHGGHAGTRGTYGRAGDVISVTAGTGISFAAGGSASGGRNFAQVGHGGYDADMTPELLPGQGGNIADILVRSLAGDIVFTASGGTSNYVQLGHGGLITGGDQTGDIEVTAEGGAIRFLAGTTTDAYALLGHGGRSSDGNRSGDLSVIADQGILFQAGTGTRAFAMLGHGGRPGPATVPVDGMPFNGNSSGDILVQSRQAGIDFRWAATSTDPGSLSFAQLGHGGSYAVGDHSGDIRVLAMGNILFQGVTGATSTRLNAYVQLGHGGAFAAGNHSGDVTVLSETGTITFRGGSRGGGDRYAQLGHGGLNATGNHQGNLSVLAQGNILFSSLGVNTAAQRSYLQLGHGGHNADATTGHSGSISVGSRTGTISFISGPDGSTESYAQLGHGGFDAAGAHNGDIVVRSGNQIVVTAGTVASPVIGGAGGSYAQIGHGGGKAAGTTDVAADLSGTITLSAQVAGDFDDLGDFDGDLLPDTVTFTSGATATAIQFTGGVANTSDQYAMLGHGGTGNLGNHSGAIDVTARRTITFVGGAGTRGFAQLGHGGHGAIATTGHSGTITVRGTGEGGVTSSFNLNPGIGLESYAQMGHGGLGATGSHSGDLRAVINNTLTLNANSGTIVNGYRAYSQIGHGGHGAAGDHEGDITILANLGTIGLTGGAASAATTDGIADERYVQIGHGGILAGGDHEGDIAILANGSVTAVGGSGATRSYVQVGHGGHEADATTGHSGRIALASRTGAISFTSGAGTSVESYVQVGHGGLFASGDHGGDLVVRAGNNLLLSGSAGADRFVPDPVDPVNNPPIRVDHRGYAQIGHGGLGSEGDRSGAITITSQIAGDYGDLGDFDGDGSADLVTIAAGTSSEGLLINGGTDAVTGANDSYAQIGHGGRLARGTNEGDITVDALRQIRAVAGQLGARTYVQIGHGGSDAAPIGGAPGTTVNDGDITVISRNNNIDFRWTAMGTLTTDGTYAQLGHGGTLTDPLLSGVNAGGDNAGDIRVSAGTNLLFRSTTGGVTTAGTTSKGNYVQIGHGGLRWTGDHSGDIAVRAGALGATGTLAFTAGDGTTGHAGLDPLGAASEGATDRYAQIGHGGAFARGSHSGDIEVLSLGNFTFTAGRNPRAYAQLGHGGLEADDPDGAGRGNSGAIRAGTQTGNMNFIYASTSTTATGTPGLQSYSQLGHGGYGTTGSNSGDVFVRTGGNLQFRGSRGNDPTGHLGSYVQLGHGGFQAEGNHGGNITVSAGIGGSFMDVFDLEGDGILDPVDFTSNNTGTITFLSGSGGTDRYAQLGHGGRLARGDHGAVDGGGNASETIAVTALGDIVFTSQGSTRSYVQLGNGGHDANLATSPRGAAANLEVISQTGAIRFNGSASDQAYAQLGNGGYITLGDHRGNLLVEAGTDIAFTASQSLTGTTGNAYVQLGHGGRGATGNHSGDIMVRAGTAGVSGGIQFLGGRASERYAQLGHGGRSASGDHSGDLTLESWGDIVFQGADYRAFTNTSSPNVATAAINGDGAAGLKLPTLAYIRPGSLSITIADPIAPEYDTLTDDGKGNLLDANGAIVGTINYANADVAFSAPIANAGSTATSTYQESNFSRSYAQLGHGGSDTTATVGSSGDIRVVAGLGGVTGNIDFKAGPGNESYAQIGHGGRAGRGDHSGDLYVDALGHVTFNGNQGLRNYAQMGHGGWDSDLNTAGSEDRGSSGDIFVNTRGLVTSTGDIRFTAGGGEEAYAQLGHGGFGTRGAASGNLADMNRIEVRSGGDIVFLSGDASGFGDDTTLRTANGRRAYAQLGHGGYDADAHNVDASGTDGLGHQADIFVAAAGAVGFEAATLVSDPLGVVNGPIAADFRNYVQLGHGGLAASGDHRGDITVQSGTGIEFQGGRIAAGATTGDGADSYAQLGHGGYTSPGYGGNDTISFTGNIDVRTTTGDIRFLGGNTTDGYVQLGHGGRAATGGSVGDISVTAFDGGVIFLAGERAQHYAQLGHGGYNARGDHSGIIEVTSQDDIVFNGGAGAQTYAQIGHGGYDADNPNPTHYPDNDPSNPVRGPTAAERVGNSGSISVESRAGSLLFTSGSANNTYTQIGHGGNLTDGDHTGDIIAKAALDIRFDASTPAGSVHPSQIGHGGYLASGGFTGDVSVEAGGAIVFTGGPTSWVQIGHGGRNDHRLSTTAPNNNNNDRYYPGTHRGDITVNAGGDLLFDAYQFPVGGATGSGGYAQIGHGGYRNAAMPGEGHSGAIDVLSGGLLRFRAGPRAQANAQIGHGGFEAFGDHGRLTVHAESGAGITTATQGGSANLANGGLAAGSVRVTIGGSVFLDDDGLGGLRDATGAVVATIDYENGSITFTGNVNAGGDPVEVFYQHGRSDIFVQARDGVEFLGDALTEVSADQAYVQIGHGGYDADFQARTLAAEGVTAGGVHHLNTPTGTPQGTSGNITVLAGVNALGTVLNPNAAIRFIAGGDDDSYAQIGNGGRATSGSHQGNITVRSTAGLTFEAGNFQPESYAQLGNGGLGATSPGQALAPGGATITIGHRGNIEVAAGLGGNAGGITFLAGSSNATGDNYAQLGHGGRSATGNHIGDIDVSAWGSILFQGGGYRSLSGTSSAGLTTAAETGASGQLLTTANIRPGHLVITIADPADAAYATIIDDGNGNLLDTNGAVVGTINYFSATVAFTTAVSNTGGAVTADYDHFNYARNYVQLGNGGSGATANAGHGGDISVVAGLGGVEGDITFNAGVSSDAYAQLGQGGNVAVGDHFGDIRVDALGDIRFTGEFNLRAYTQLGNGGYNSDLNTTNANNPWGVNSAAIGNRGDILVNTRTNLLTNRGGIFFTAGGGEESSAQLGHGGFANRGVNSGTILDVRATGDIVFLSGDGSGRGDDTGASRFGDGRRSFAHLGHGGYDADTHNVAADATDGLGHFSDIVVMSGGAIRFIATDIVSDPTGAVAGPIANDFRNYVHLGHGGYASNGDHRGNLTVVAGTGIEFRSGGVQATATANTSQDNYAQLGHGGYTSSGYGGNDTNAFTGDIAVLSRAGDIRFLAGNGTDSYVQLGHGGRAANEGAIGAIRVAAQGGSFVLAGGSRAQAYGLLGHGGDTTLGNRSGDVFVRAAGEVQVLAGAATRAASMIGHGGYDGDGDHFGNILVSAGSGALATHLGTGLFDDLGDYDLDGSADLIQFAPVTAGQSSVRVTAAGGTDAFALIGHGGRSSGNVLGTTAASTMTGHVGVAAHGDIVLSGSSGTRAFTQIGHGGWEDPAQNMTLGGDISVISQTGLLRVLAGTGSEAYAMVGHGALRNTATNVPLGSRSGSIYIEAGNWEVVPTGTTALARVGHRSQAANNGLTAGHSFTIFGNGGDGTSAYRIDEAMTTLWGIRDHLNGGGGANFAAIGDLTVDLPLSYASAVATNVIATGDVDLRRSIQNAGSGDVNLVSGWNGLTAPLDFLDVVPMRSFDVAAILADETAWGNHDARLTLGGGSQNGAAAVGSAGGNTVALGHAIDLIASNTNPGARAQLGFSATPGISPTGDILARSKGGGIRLLGGSTATSSAQIGHLALAGLAPDLSGRIEVISGADLTLLGGGGLQSSVSIGHGGANAVTTSMGGDIRVSVVGNLGINAGTSGGAYAQIGHGGFSTDGDIAGDIAVTAGGDITMGTTALSNGAYAKIGHGDDLRGTLTSQGGIGSREGDIVVSAGRGIALTSAQVGHVGAGSPATAVSGATWIGVSRNDPTNRSGGNLTANSASSFSGTELRFYLPRRDNNRIAAGANINGSVYGGVRNPWPVQRAEEYANFVQNGSRLTQPAQHDNSLGSRPAPTTAAAFAFYYDTLVLAPAIVFPGPGTPPGNGGSPGTPGKPGQPGPALPDWLAYLLDDRTNDDWLNDQESAYSAPGSGTILYEGFTQYGPDGESVFELQSPDGNTQEDVVPRSEVLPEAPGEAE